MLAQVSTILKYNFAQCVTNHTAYICNLINIYIILIVFRVQSGWYKDNACP